MTFEEIKKIDRGPDYEMYSDSVVDYSANGPSFNLYYYIMLLVLYMKKFDETYGTEFYLKDNIESLFRYAGDYEIEDTFYDEVFSFEYEAMDCFIRTAEKYGFESFVYDFTSEEYEIKETKDPEKELMKKLISEIGTADDVWVKIFEDCSEMLLDSSFCLETGTVIIIRNHEMGAYKQICSKYDELLQNRLKEEQREIERTIRKLTYPVFYYHILESDYVDDYYYMCLVIGFDGYQSCSFMQLNISWLINCFILKQLFQDFKQKLMTLLSNMEGAVCDENGE